MRDHIPQFDQLIEPLFRVLKNLGGSASIAEIDDAVAEALDLPEELLEVPHNPEKSNQTEFQYRLAWARTYLKKCGLIENTARGVWVIAPDGRNVPEINSSEVVRKVREQHREQQAANDIDVPANVAVSPAMEPDNVPDEADAWRVKLHRVLTQEIDASGFERLVQRLLRESGFIHVEVTGRSGDGGIDGKGITRINGMLSFHVIFQCKRYQGSVGAPHVRDFRGAMVGRADKGLLITTGMFSRDAIKEAPATAHHPSIWSTESSWA